MGVYVQMGWRNRIDTRRGAIGRLATRTTAGALLAEAREGGPKAVDGRALLVEEAAHLLEAVLRLARLLLLELVELPQQEQAEPLAWKRGRGGKAIGERRAIRFRLALHTCAPCTC